MTIPAIHASSSLISLFDRAIDALARTDTASLGEVLADCNDAVLPASAEEFSRALTQQATFEKVLEQTGRNLRILRGDENVRYGRRRDANS